VKSPRTQDRKTGTKMTFMEADRRQLAQSVTRLLRNQVSRILKLSDLQHKHGQHLVDLAKQSIKHDQHSVPYCHLANNAPEAVFQYLEDARPDIWENSAVEH
jgi:hypothetical protein